MPPHWLLLVEGATALAASSRGLGANEKACQRCVVTVTLPDRLSLSNGGQYVDVDVDVECSVSAKNGEYLGNTCVILG